MWLADVLDKEREPPKGRDPRENWGRDRAIVDAVKRLCNETDAKDNELPRFEPIMGHKGYTICDAVAKVFGESYATVQALWRKYREWENEEIPDAVWDWLGQSAHDARGCFRRGSPRPPRS